MLVELTYDAEMMQGNNEKEKAWFFNHILKSKRRNDLILHSNEVGDEIGTIKVLEIKN